MALDVGILRADHRTFVDRVAEVESNTSTLQPNMSQMQQDIKILAAGMEALQKRAEDTESHSRRNNVRFMGFAEGSEMPNPDLFLSLGYLPRSEELV